MSWLGSMDVRQTVVVRTGLHYVRIIRRWTLGLRSTKGWIKTSRVERREERYNGRVPPRGWVTGTKAEWRPSGSGGRRRTHKLVRRARHLAGVPAL